MTRRKSIIPELIRGGSLPLRVLRVVLTIYFFLLLVVHPLCFDQYYNNLGTFKWKFFSGISFGLMPNSVLPIPGGLVLALLCLAWYLVDSCLHDGLRVGMIAKKLTVTDGFVLAFVATTLLSAAFGVDKSVVLSGFPGWYMGVKTQLALCLLWLLASRFVDERLRCGMLAAMAGAGGLVGGMGLLNRIGFDVLGMHAGSGMNRDVALTSYLSTVGNRGWYATLLCVLLPVSLWAFQYTEETRLRVLSGVAAGITGTALITSDAAAGIIGFAVMLLVFFLLALREETILGRFAELLLILLLSMRVPGIVWAISGRESAPLQEGTARLLALSPLMWIVIAVLAAGCAALRMRRKKGAGRALPLDKWRRRIMIFLAIGCGVVFLYVLLNSTGLIPYPLSAPGLKITRDTGSYRVWLWDLTARCFGIVCRREPFRVLLGMGPGSMYRIFMGISPELEAERVEFLSVAWNSTDTYIANAHNEWYTMFLEEGLPGGIAYLGIFVTFFLSSLRASDERPIAVLGCAAAAGYFADTCFSYQQITGVPYMFVLMGLVAGAVNRPSSKGR